MPIRSKHPSLGILHDRLRNLLMTVYDEEALLTIAEIFKMTPPKLIKKIALQYAEWIISDQIPHTEEQDKILKLYLEQNRHYPYDSE